MEHCHQVDLCYFPTLKQSQNTKNSHEECTFSSGCGECDTIPIANTMTCMQRNLRVLPSQLIIDSSSPVSCPLLLYLYFQRVYYYSYMKLDTMNTVILMHMCVTYSQTYRYTHIFSNTHRSTITCVYMNTVIGTHPGISPSY